MKKIKAGIKDPAKVEKRVSEELPVGDFPEIRQSGRMLSKRWSHLMCILIKQLELSIRKCMTA